MIEAVLFDLGDTLQHIETSSTRKLVESVVRAGHHDLVEKGLNPPPLGKYLRSLYLHMLWAYARSKVTRREIQLITALHGIHRRMGISQSMEETEGYLGDCIYGIRQYVRTPPDALDVLRQLREAGLKLGLVSNTVIPPAMLDGYLDKEKLLEFFPVRIYSSKVRYMKPHPRIFQIALDQINVPAERTVFVGDRLDNDVKGASRLGMKTIMVIPPDPVRRSPAGPDHVVRRLADIPPILLSQKC